MKRKIVMVAWVLALSMAGVTRSYASSSERVDPGAIVVDTIIVRPFCFVAAVLGSAAFVVSLPFSIPSKSVHRASDSLVVRPWQTTFTRPLGDLDNLRDY